MSNTPAAQKTSRAPKIIAGICIALMVLLLAAFATVNAFIQVAYQPFYSAAQRAFPIPGTNNGFIVQDLDRLEDGSWLFSGYTSNGPSPVYKQDEDGTAAKLTIARPDGSIYDGHGSGITSNETHVFLTDDEGFLVFDLDAFQDATDGSTVQAIGRRTMEFAPAFMNIEDGTLYLGNFYHPGAYETPEHHRFDTPGGNWNPAVMYAYPADAQGTYGYADQATCVYSIPERIQGMCLTSDGQMVLSQSYGLASSHLLVYDFVAQRASAVEADIEEGTAGTFTADGQEVPLFFLDSLSLDQDITAPPMSEGIEWDAGKVYISCESASDKYLFGKLYGAGYVYELAIE